MAKKTFIAGCIFLFLLTITGCATTGTDKMISRQQQHLQAQKGYWDSFVELQEHSFLANAEREKILEFINAKPGYRDNIIADAKTKFAEASTPQVFYLYHGQLVDAQKAGLLTDNEITKLQQYLYNLIETKNKNGNVAFMLDDSISHVDPLYSANHQAIIFNRTVEGLLSNESQNSSVAENKIDSIVKYLNSDFASQTDKHFFQSSITKFKVKSIVLVKCLSELMPEYVEEIRNNNNLYVDIETIPEDKLFEYDLADQFQNNSAF